MEAALRKEIMPSVNLTCIRTSKFKTSCLSINLLTPIDKKSASYGALLPQVLRRGTTRYPNMESISSALDELYGTRIEPYVRKKGEVQCIGFYADFVDDAYVPGGEKMLEKTASMLGKLLLSPATVGGRLNSEYVESEKANLIDRIRASMNDKIKYSMKRLMEIMCAGEKYGVDVLGSEEQTEKITVGKLTRYYRELLSTAAVEVFYCGSSDQKRVETAVLESLESLPRGETGAELITEIKLDAPENVGYHSESMDVTQGKLAIGFRLGEAMKGLNFAALSVFNAVYGGSVTSKLFMNVREKLSLCYFASSKLDRRKGIMLVISGIEFDKYEAAIKEILLQLENAGKGDIDDSELESAKRAVVNELKTIMDSGIRLEDYYLGQALDEVFCSPEEMAALAEQVTKDEVTKIAAGVRPDTVYFLKGNGEA